MPRRRATEPQRSRDAGVIGKGGPADPAGKKPADNPPLLTPAGRLHLSMEDWAKVLRVFLNDGAPLVEPETIDHLLYDPGEGEKGRSMSMGWASGERLGVSHAMQGSNTMWAAAALMDRDRGRTALVATNDGRMPVIVSSAHLAERLFALGD